ncbi:MAG: metalloregulator ArsR/SmtB family transcription factor [Pseudomonadota bacterium]
MSEALTPTVNRLRAAGEPTRLRILALLRCGDLAVGELVDILGLSQPRLSHQLKVLTNAGLVTRLPEGAWVFYRAKTKGPCADLINLALSQADLENSVFLKDRRQLQVVLDDRASSAASYFDSIAAHWDAERALHYPESAIEAAILEIVGDGPFDQIVDLGTGTGRILSLLAPRARQAEGLDLSHQMLTVARSNLLKAGVTNANVRHGDACMVPFEASSVDLVIIHQVLHFIVRPALAIEEAARILRPGGRLVIVDFAPHMLEFLRSDHGHRRLGVADEALGEWARGTGLTFRPVRHFESPTETAGLAVKIWTAQQPTANFPQKEAAA